MLYNLLTVKIGLKSVRNNHLKTYPHHILMELTIPIKGEDGITHANEGRRYVDDKKKVTGEPWFPGLTLKPVLN
jgi:hypothetical protein